MCGARGEGNKSVGCFFASPPPPSTEGFSVEERVQARHNILFIPNHSTYHSFYQHSMDFFLKKNNIHVRFLFITPSFWREGGGGRGRGVKVKVTLTHKI